MARQETTTNRSANGPDSEPRGCGWFDSSHDLQCGLSVTEHSTSEALAAVAPLGWWLQWELEACVRPGLR